MSIRTRPLWQLRLTREAPRYLLAIVCLFGLLASARYAIAPPRPVAARPESPPIASDLSAQGFAAEFTRLYLTWNASDPVASVAGLEPFSGAQAEPAAGLVLPASGHETVSWVEVVQAREPSSGTHVYTVAAQTDRGLLYLTVPVERTPAGSLALAGYPAFVGPPAISPAVAPRPLQPVSDRALATVVRRGLANYLSNAPQELEADLAEGARVSSPSPALRLLSTDRLQWAPGGGAVDAQVQAEDALGARHTLTYELDVTRVRGRWEIAAVQTEPDA